MKHNILILHKFFRLTKFFPATAGTYGLSMAFSPSGRIQSRKRDITASFNSFADDIFGYCEDLHPHAPVRIFETRGHSLTDLVWDGAGNLAQANTFHEMQYENSRFLFWTEDSRLHTTADQKHFSYYAYDHAGERTFKLTGSNNVMDVNANVMFTAAWLKTPTIYPTPYLVLSSHGYTKHYYVGSERLCARIGGGGLFAPFTETPLTNRADSLFQASLSECQNRVLDGNQEGCIHSLVSGYDEVIQSYLEAPQRLVAQAAIDLTQFDHDINHCFTGCGPEPEVYYYHGDHLGSASWITDAHGNPVQHLQYLPFGEPFVNQHTTGYEERFTFTGKERDTETGYSYFGARYYDSDLSGLFISVDPMSDKYPNISPYAYCAWNPLKIVDPDGRDWYETDGGEVKWTKYHSQKEMKDNNLKGKYLGQAHVIFQGSRSERLGKGGNIFGEGGRTANVTVYGPGGENDITHLTGFTMTSDYSKHSAIAEGLYNANYDIAGKSGSLKSNWVLNHRGTIGTVDNEPNLSPYAGHNYGKPVKDGIFIHSTNPDGRANGNVSTGCLLLAPNDFKKFNSIMSGVTNFSVRVIRTQQEYTPLMGVTGPVPNMNIVQKITRK